MIPNIHCVCNTLYIYTYIYIHIVQYITRTFNTSDVILHDQMTCLPTRLPACLLCRMVQAVRDFTGSISKRMHLCNQHLYTHTCANARACVRTGARADGSDYRMSAVLKIQINLHLCVYIRLLHSSQLMFAQPCCTQSDTFYLDGYWNNFIVLSLVAQWRLSAPSQKTGERENVQA